MIADGAATGPEIAALISTLKDKAGCLVLPESFEWLILKSGVIPGQKDMTPSIAKVLQQPWNYIDSMKYSSWERFFTSFLVQITNRLYTSYGMIQFRYPSDKGRLPKAYQSSDAKRVILETLFKLKSEGSSQQSTDYFS